MAQVSGAASVKANADGTISERLAAFAVGLAFDDIPAAVRERSKYLILDALGIGLAASREPFARTFVDGLTDIGEGGELRNKLVVEGGAAGLTQHSIDFLIASPLPEGLTTTVSNWRAEGDAEMAIDVEMLLGAGTGVDVRTELSIDENKLALLDYGLNVSGLSGRVVFDTRTGLDSEALRGEIFDSPLAMQLGSVQADRVIETITLAANGSVAPEQLADLALTSPLVDAMLQQAEGVLEYQGLLSIEQGSESLYPTTLTVQSTLEGVAIVGPDPLTKEATDAIDFDLSLGFGESGQWHRGQLGKRLAFDLSFNDEMLTQGLVFLG